jgi:hypothetical protein
VSANSAIEWDGRIGGQETTKRRRIDEVVPARRSASRAAGGRRTHVQEDKNMRYAVAWLLGVPGIVILLWMLVSAQ